MYYGCRQGNKWSFQPKYRMTNSCFFLSLFSSSGGLNVWRRLGADFWPENPYLICPLVVCSSHFFVRGEIKFPPFLLHPHGLQLCHCWLMGQPPSFTMHSPYPPHPFHSIFHFLLPCLFCLGVNQVKAWF